MAERPYDPNERELLEALESKGNVGLSEEILKKWDPDKLLRLVSKRAGKGEPLDYSTRSRYERLFQRLGKRVDLSRVRIYTGEFAKAVTEAHEAEAITVGDTGMVLMRGLPDRSPLTRAGDALYAHELTHVAQGQAGGLLRSSTSGDVEPGSETAEAEAQQVEQMITSGSEDPSVQDTAEQEAELYELVRARVIDMLCETERVHIMRGGRDIYRP